MTSAEISLGNVRTPLNCLHLDKERTRIGLHVARQSFPAFQTNAETRSLIISESAFRAFHLLSVVYVLSCSHSIWRCQCVYFALVSITHMYTNFATFSNRFFRMLWLLSSTLLSLPAGSVADPGFWIRAVKFHKFSPKPPKLCTVTVGLGLHFTWNDWNQYENWNLWK